MSERRCCCQALRKGTGGRDPHAPPDGTWSAPPPPAPRRVEQERLGSALAGAKLLKPPMEGKPPQNQTPSSAPCSWPASPYRQGPPASSPQPVLRGAVTAPATAVIDSDVAGLVGMGPLTAVAGAGVAAVGATADRGTGARSPGGHGGGNGETLRLRNGHADRPQGGTHPRRLRLLDGTLRRTLLPRRLLMIVRRGNQRNPAQRHSKPTDQAKRAPCAEVINK